MPSLPIPMNGDPEWIDEYRPPALIINIIKEPTIQTDSFKIKPRPYTNKIERQKSATNTIKTILTKPNNGRFSYTSSDQQRQVHSISF